MYPKVIPQRLYFHGVPLYDVVIDEAFNSDYQGIHHYFRLSPPERHLTITIETANRDEYYCISELLFRMRTCHGRLISLGTGKVCEHCGTYSPAGRANCWNCNALTVDRELIKPTETDLIMRDIQETNAFFTGDSMNRMEIMVEFSFTEISYEAIMQFFAPKTKIVEIPWSYTLDTGKYICEFCGTVTHSGQNCGGCGGHQLPLRDLVEIEHNCLYCGNKAVGGIICQQCGARVGGKSLDELLRN